MQTDKNQIQEVINVDYSKTFIGYAKIDLLNLAVNQFVYNYVLDNPYFYEINLKCDLLGYHFSDSSDYSRIGNILSIPYTYSDINIIDESNNYYLKSNILWSNYKTENKQIIIDGVNNYFNIVISSLYRSDGNALNFDNLSASLEIIIKAYPKRYYFFEPQY